MRADREFVATTTLSYRKNDSVNDDYKSLATVEVTVSGPELGTVSEAHRFLTTHIANGLIPMHDGIETADKAVEPPSFD